MTDLISQDESEQELATAIALSLGHDDYNETAQIALTMIFDEPEEEELARAVAMSLGHRGFSRPATPTGLIEPALASARKDPKQEVQPERVSYPVNKSQAKEKRKSRFQTGSESITPASLNNGGPQFNPVVGPTRNSANDDPLECQIALCEQIQDPDLLSSTALLLIRRFEAMGRISDLQRAIMFQEIASALTPNDHAEKAWYLNILGVALRCRFDRLGDRADVENAISAQQTAVMLTPDGHAAKPSCLINLGNSFYRRFEQFGDMADIDSAISAQKKAVSLVPDTFPDKADYLSNLGCSFNCRFQRLGDLEDIHNSISAHQAAAALARDNDPNKAAHLTNLGNSLRSRFERLEDIADLHNAVSAQQKSVTLTPFGHPELSSRLTNLGIALFRRFEQLGDIADIDEAISSQQGAISLTQDGHPDKPTHLTNLGNSLSRRFERCGDISDLDNAIATHQTAVDITSDDNAGKPARLNNLGLSLSMRFEQLGDRSDIDRAVHVYQHAVNLTPDGHPDKPGRLRSLSVAFERRFKLSHDRADIQNAMDSAHLAAVSLTGKSLTRFQAAMFQARLAHSIHPISFGPSSLECYSTAMNLIPQVVWLGKVIPQRYQDVGSLGAAASEAAAAACSLGEFELAFEWLVQGRSIVWGQVLNLRTPLDDLREAHPDLAVQLERAAQDLEDLSSPSSLQTSVRYALSPEEAARAHQVVAGRWDELLAQVRSLPNYQGFLRPKKWTDIASVAQNIIVVINVHDQRCDALILRPKSWKVDHVHLPNLDQREAQNAYRLLFRLLKDAKLRQRATQVHSEGPAKSLEGILAMLWRTVVQPILSYLGYYTTQPQAKLPHITWCATGPLAFLPLHAAGIYDGANEDKAFNYVISSYAPSLTALLEQSRKSSHDDQGGILVVTQPSTPGLPPLPGTLKEVERVQHWMSNRKLTRIDGPQATVETVNQEMENHSSIHFACHGIQDTSDPTKSAFYLHDGRLELGDIMRKQLKHADLAFLSACQTATGDEKLPEEAVHLAAGMFVAGYRTVIATMWSIGDEDGLDVADSFYSHLVQNPGSGKAEAFYVAVAKLRKKVGEKAFTRWIPFIHIGY